MTATKAWLLFCDKRLFSVSFFTLEFVRACLLLSHVCPQHLIIPSRFFAVIAHILQQCYTLPFHIGQYMRLHFTIQLSENGFKAAKRFSIFNLTPLTNSSPTTTMNRNEKKFIQPARWWSDDEWSASPHLKLITKTQREITFQSWSSQSKVIGNFLNELKWGSGTHKSGLFPVTFWQVDTFSFASPVSCDRGFCAIRNVFRDTICPGV